MATGYDNRQSTRQSFARQTATSPEARARRVATNVPSLTTRGGQATGGGNVVMSTTAGLSNNAGANIPQFLEGLFEPAIQERQRALMIEGAVAAADGMTMETIQKDQPWYTRVFGPTNFEQGASVFHQRANIAAFERGIVEDMDSLKKEDPKNLPRLFVERAAALNTGDALTDAAVTEAVIGSISRYQPLIAQERVKWQQSELVKQHSGLIGQLGDTYQTIQLRVGSEEVPDEVALQAAHTARTEFVASLAPPPGMTPEAYTGAMKDFYANALSRQQWHVVLAMEDAGFVNSLPLEDQATLRDARERATSRSAMDALADPDIKTLWNQLDWDIEAGKVSPADMPARVEEINALAKRRTGNPEPLIAPTKEVEWSGQLHANTVRLLERQEDLEVRQREREADQQAEAQKDIQNGLAARTAILTGDIGAAALAGVKDGDLSSAHYALVAQEGNLAAMKEPFERFGYLPDITKSYLNGRLTGSLGGWSEAFSQGYEEWKTINSMNSGMAAAIYGDNHARMLLFHNLHGSGRVTGEVAFAQVFGPQARVPELSAPRRSELNKALEDEVLNPTARGGFAWMRRDPALGGRALNPNTRRLFAQQIGAMAGEFMQAPEVTGKSAVNDALASAISSRKAEVLGAVGWINTGATPPARTFSEEVGGGSPEEIGDAFHLLMADRFKAAGVPGVNPETSDIRAYRLPPENGQHRIGITVVDTNGRSTSINVTHSQVRQVVDRTRDTRTRDRAYTRWIGTRSTLHRSTLTPAQERAEFNRLWTLGYSDPGSMIGGGPSSR